MGLTTSNVVIAQSSNPPQNSSSHYRSSTEILILGTPHLSHIENDFSPVLLDSLISVLKGYQPDAIGIEEISGAQVATMKRRGGVYKSVVESFGAEQLQYGQKAQQVLNISWAKADIIADSLLDEVQQVPKVTDSTRLELIQYLLASYRLHTATLQWSYVSKEFKIKQNAVPKETMKALDQLLDSPNESSSISLRLAHELGLQRIYPIDDHMEKDYYNRMESQFDKALTDSLIQTVTDASYFRKYQHMMKQGLQDSSLYALYRYMNSPNYTKQDEKVQWRNTFLESKSNKYNKILRTRLALWEVRNLNIAAHIRKASAQHIGGRILITIGASHKSFLDRYLDEMMGVKTLDLSDLVNKQRKTDE